MSPKLRRLSAIVFASLLAGWGTLSVELLASGEPAGTCWMPFLHWRLNHRIDPLGRWCEDWAQRICSVTQDPRERAALAESLVAHSIAYTSSSLVDGIERIPLPGEAVARGQGNCVAQSLVLASLLQKLGFSAQIHTRPDHAWVSARISGMNLVFLPESMQPALGRYLTSPATLSKVGADPVLCGCLTPLPGDLNTICSL